MSQGLNRSTFQRLLAAGVAALGLLGAGSAMADKVYWSVGVNAPIDGVGGVRTRIGNTPPAPRVYGAPVIVAPAPVYAPPPPPHYVYPTAYYGAPRVVYAPPPVVYYEGGYGPGWRHGHGWRGDRRWHDHDHGRGLRAWDQRRGDWHRGRRD